MGTSLYCFACFHVWFVFMSPTVLTNCHPLSRRIALCPWCGSNRTIATLARTPKAGVRFWSAIERKFGRVPLPPNGVERPPA